jgi:hypothetical protein
MKMFAASLKFVAVAGIAALVIALVLFPPPVKDVFAFFTNNSAAPAAAKVAPASVPAAASTVNLPYYGKKADTQPSLAKPAPALEATPAVPLIIRVANPDERVDDSKLTAKQLQRMNYAQAKYTPTRNELNDAQYLFEAASDVRQKILEGMDHEQRLGNDVKEFQTQLLIFDGFVGAAKRAQQRGYDMIYNKNAFTPTGQVVDVDNAVAAVDQAHLEYQHLRYDLRQAYEIALGTFLHYKRFVDHDLEMPDLSHLNIH